MREIIVILFVAFCSCSSNPDVEKSLAAIGIHLKDKYTILNNDTSVAIGAASKTFNLKISPKDFNQIVAQLKLVKRYSEFKENDFPNEISEMSYNDKISAFKSGSKYFYNVSKANTNENYQVVLVGQNKLSFTYSED